MFTIVLDFIDTNIKIIQHKQLSLDNLEELLFHENGYNFSQSNIQWMTLDNMQVYFDSEKTLINVNELVHLLNLQKKLDVWKVELRERLSEYQEVYIPENTESLSILEYGENEFFGGKKEVYEDILEYMEQNGI